MRCLLALSDTYGCSLPHIWLQGLFVFSLIWCVGATVDDAGRAKFDAFLRALLKREAPGAEGALAVLAVPGAPQPMAPDPKDLKFTRPLPEKGTVFDVVWTGKDWVEWMGTQPHYQVRKGASRHPTSMSMCMACPCPCPCPYVRACMLRVHVCVRVMHACMCMCGGVSAGAHGCQHMHMPGAQGCQVQRHLREHLRDGADGLPR